MKAAQAAGQEAPPGARSVKVVLVGDGGCGKTSLLMVFAEGAFPEVSAGPSGAAGRRGLGASFPTPGGTCARPASPQSVGLKAVLTLPAGVTSPVKCQECHLPGGGVPGTDLGSLGNVAGPKRALGGTAWLRRTDSLGFKSRLCDLQLCALGQAAYPLCACFLNCVIGITVVPTSQGRSDERVHTGQGLSSELQQEALTEKWPAFFLGDIVSSPSSCPYNGCPVGSALAGKSTPAAQTAGLAPQSSPTNSGALSTLLSLCEPPTPHSTSPGWW